MPAIHLAIVRYLASNLTVPSLETTVSSLISNYNNPLCLKQLCKLYQPQLVIAIITQGQGVYFVLDQTEGTLKVGRVQCLT